MNITTENFYTPKYNFIKPCCLKQNAISFGAMKKSQFHGIDILVVNQFKAPIEKFNTNEDFQNWCNNETKKINLNEPCGRSKQTATLRKWVLRNWINYLNKNNVSRAKQLLIYNGLKRDINPKDDRLPPIFREEILKKTLRNCETILKSRPNAQINFIKCYKEDLGKDTIEEFGESLDRKKTGWVIIPSKIRSPENFKKNTELLKVLSHHNWCTNMYYADPYLEKGDFHIYLDKGNPVLGIRFSEDTAKEIQGELNNSKIPIKYANIAKEHLKNYQLAFKIEMELEDVEVSIQKFKDFKSQFPKGIDKASEKEILEAFNMKVEEDKSGMLTVKGDYRIPIYRGPYFTLADLGINENRLLKKIKKIEGDANFEDSKLTSLENLEYIGGNVRFNNSEITNLGKLKEIRGNADFRNAKIENLENLKVIGKDAYFGHSDISSLGNLEYIGGGADFKYSKLLNNLGNLKYIGENADFSYSEITSLKNLEYIGGSVNFNNSKINDMGELKNVGRNAYIDKYDLIPQLSIRGIDYFIGYNF